MSQQLDVTTAYNFHKYLSVPYQHGDTSSLNTGKLMGRRLQYGRDNQGLGRCSWQQFRGRGETSINIITFYKPVPPAAGWGPGSVYAQQLTHFANLNRQECPRTDFLSDLSDDIIIWNSKGYQIILMGDINKYTPSKKIRNSVTKIVLREIITDRHGSMVSGTTIS